jgi:hypothetical protein
MKNHENRSSSLARKNNRTTELNFFMPVFLEIFGITWEKAKNENPNYTNIHEVFKYYQKQDRRSKSLSRHRPKNKSFGII